MRDNVIRQRSYDFALEVIGLCRRLAAGREMVLSRQLLRSGTSIGANVEEAQSAQSRRDFNAKMQIALKEARESSYWLRLLRDSGGLPAADADPMLARADELIRLLTRILKTSRGE